MYGQALQHYPYIDFVVAGMLLFLAAFAWILVLTYHPKARHDENAALPLQDEEIVHGRK